MKCIRCNHDSKFPQRTNRTCPNCEGKFAFEPREKDPISDAGFEQAIKTVSSDGTIHFLADQLYYDICRRKPRRVVDAVVVVIVIALLIVGIWAGIQKNSIFLLISLAPLCVLALLVIARSRSNRVSMTPTAFELLLGRWTNAHGRPEMLIRTPMLSKGTMSAESDLADYSFDRAVICDRPELVDFLLANQFHFENNCAILAVNGYPEGPFETIRTMLSRNPELHVYTLHDATLEGCLVSHTVATDPKWFGDKGLKISDVGLRPDQAAGFSGLYQSGTETRLDDIPGILPREAKWLSRYSLSIAVVKPEHLLKRLFTAINRNRPTAVTEMAESSSGATGGMPLPLIIPLGIPHSNNTTSVEFDSQSLISDAKDRDGDIDSFG